MHQLEVLDYVNERPRRRQKRSEDTNQTERRVCQLLLLSFAVLCIIQAILNVSLRVALHSGKESTHSGCNTTDLSMDVEQDCKEERPHDCNTLQDQVNALVRDKNMLQNSITELTNMLKNLGEERDRLKNAKKDCETKRPCNCNRLQDQVNTLTRDNNLLQNRNTGLTNMVKNLEDERDRLKNAKKDCETKRPCNCNRLQEEVNALNRDNSLLQNTITNLNNLVKTLKEERDRPREPSGCSQQCPENWTEVNSRCYFLSTNTKTWEDSRRDCQSKGADLVVIDSREEQEALYQLGGDTYLLFWIGLRDTTRTYQFKWVDLSALTTPFWQADRPDRSPTKALACVEMYHHNPVLASWNNADCQLKRRWLCEREKCPRL